MTWYIRKSLRLGPIRFSLSKRGVGVSAGVKGARIGVDATGKPYVAGGRYGLYFRHRLGRPTNPQPAPLPLPPSPPDASASPVGWGDAKVVLLLVVLLMSVALAIVWFTKL